MLDLRLIREDKDKVIKLVAKKGNDVTNEVNKIYELDLKRRDITFLVEGLKNKQNVVSKEIPKLKKEGKTPTAAQKVQIEKEIKRAINLRSACQAANLGVSLLLLGLIVPIWTRNNTKKKHAEALRIAQEQRKQGISEKETTVPQKVQ